MTEFQLISLKAISLIVAGLLVLDILSKVLTVGNYHDRGIVKNTFYVALGVFREYLMRLLNRNKKSIPLKLFLFFYASLAYTFIVLLYFIYRGEKTLNIFPIELTIFYISFFGIIFLYEYFFVGSNALDFKIINSFSLFTVICLNSFTVMDPHHSFSSGFNLLTIAINIYLIFFLVKDKLTKIRFNAEKHFYHLMLVLGVSVNLIFSLSYFKIDLEQEKFVFVIVMMSLSIIIATQAFKNQIKEREEIKFSLISKMIIFLGLLLTIIKVVLWKM